MIMINEFIIMKIFFFLFITLSDSLWKATNTVMYQNSDDENKPLKSPLKG